MANRRFSKVGNRRYLTDDEWADFRRTYEYLTDADRFDWTIKMDDGWEPTCPTCHGTGRAPT